MASKTGGRKRPSFIVGRDTGRTEEVRLGLAWLLATETDGERLLVTPIKDQLTRGHLGGVLGEAGPALAAGKSVRGPTGETLRAATSRTFPPSRWPGGPVLAPWPDEKSLAAVDQDFRVQALCVIPWVYEWVQPWAVGRRAIDLLAADEKVAAPQISNPVVEQAMKSLKLSVNLSTGLGHPSDRSAAIDTFRTLKKARITWDAAEIEVWAIDNGWMVEDARALRDIAQGVFDGRRYQAGGRHWRPDIVKYWREEAQKQ